MTERDDTAIRFARGRRTSRPMEPARRAALVREVVVDPRFDVLPPRARVAILALVGNPDLPGDGSGCRYFPKRDQWAAIANLSPSTLDRAISDLSEARVLRVQRWLRPDGRQGASTYVLDPVYDFLAATEQGASPTGEHGASANKVPHAQDPDKVPQTGPNKVPQFPTPDVRHQNP